MYLSILLRDAYHKRNDVLRTWELMEVLIDSATFCRHRRWSSNKAEEFDDQSSIDPEVSFSKDFKHLGSWDNANVERNVRQGIDLATTLERIEKNFVITDPRLPDNPIVRSLLD